MARLSNSNYGANVTDDAIFGGFSDVTNSPNRIMKERRCKHCNKLLSTYNLNDYCFVHIGIGRKLADERKVTQDQKRVKQARDRYTKKYKRKG